MSDVAEVKEAIEEFEKAAGPDFFDCEQKVLDAARRWVRVVEGLDYEAAAREMAADDGYDWDELSPAARESLILRASEYVVAAVGVEKETGDE